MSGKKNKEDRLLQRELACELVGIVHGEEVALECAKIAAILFGEGVSKMTLSDLEFIKGALPGATIRKNEDFVAEKHLVEMGLVSSKGEAIRLVKQNGIHTERLFNKFILIRKGKKEHGLLEMK